MSLLINKDAIWAVAEHADDVDVTASSHWRVDRVCQKRHPLIDNPFDFSYGINGFNSIGPIGAISTKTGLLPNTMHQLLQVPIRWKGRPMRSFRNVDRAARQIIKRQGRAYDKDVLRHALTLGLLCDHLPLSHSNDPIAVIGDGFANMTALIMETLPHSRVILVNLTKTLLVDLAFLYRAFPNIGYAYVDTESAMKEALARTDIRVLAVRADFFQVLRNAPLQLGINILSMMEMTPAVTEGYFGVLRACVRAETAFYCCNRTEKTLSDGTITRFMDYPWNSADQILVDEYSPWDQIGYHGRLPFYYRANPIWHRLVYLHKVPAR